MLTAGSTPPADLLDLAEKRLEELTSDEAESVIDAILQRLFDPDQTGKLTICAFQSSL